MRNREVLLMASVLALLRGEMTVRGIAERFGVTEAQVAGWRDIFEIAGMLALSNVLAGNQPGAPRALQQRPAEVFGSDPTTFGFGDPTTHGGSWTTTPDTSTTSTTPDTSTTLEADTTGGKRRTKGKGKKRKQSAKKARTKR